MCLSVEFVHINVTFVLKTDITQKKSRPDVSELDSGRIGT